MGLVLCSLHSPAAARGGYQFPLVFQQLTPSQKAFPSGAQLWTQTQVTPRPETHECGSTALHKENNHEVAQIQLSRADPQYCENSKFNDNSQVRELSRPVSETQGIFHGKTTAHLKQNRRQQNAIHRFSKFRGRKQGWFISVFLLQSVASSHKNAMCLMLIQHLPSQTLHDTQLHCEILDI